MEGLDVSTDECHFLIPLSKEDLLKSSPGQYWVEKLLNRKECIDKLKGIKKDISNRGCSCVVDHFDTLFSILFEKEISFTQLEEVYDGVIMRLVNDLPHFIRETLKSDNHRIKHKATNIIKMNLYIFSLFEKSYEDKLSFKSENFISEPKRLKGGRTTKLKSSKNEETWDWNMKKKNAFIVICEILQQKLNEIWPSHIVEESLINLIGNCCYKAFENGDIGLAKLKILRDTVSQVMAVLVASYNHGLTFIPKAIQLMKDNEHIAPAISNTAIIMAKEYKCSTVIPKLLKELNSAIQEQDIPGLAKSFATFITDIAEADPSLLLASVKILSVNLIVEPYVVRNATLIAFCEIILKFYSIENLDDEGKEVRDTLLTHLHNHLRDQNSYVRSKVLQLWSKLASACVIPRSFYLPVLLTAKNRISDKSSIASKNAIQLFTAVLQKNIYAAKLNLSETRGQLLQQKQILKNMSAKRSLSREEAWPQIEVNLILELNKYFADLENDSEEDEIVPTQSVNIKQVILIVIQLIHSGHFQESIKLLKQAELQFPDAQEIRCNMDKNSDKVEYYTAVFRKIFTKVSDIHELMPTETGEDPEEYSKQKARVEYLEESLQFTLLMNEVSKDVNAILKSKSVMGVNEAIEFFTVAYQFGIPDAKLVLRSILLLVRCDQPSIKDAVAAAFKRLYLDTCQSTQKAKSLQIARRLIKFLKDLNMEQKGALEDLIDLWIQNDELDKEFIHILWEKFAKKNDAVTDEESISALILLDMMAFKKPTLVTSNLDIIIEAGFNKHEHLMAAEYSCKILSKLRMIMKDGKPMRLPNDHLLFETVQNVLVSNFVKTETELNGYKPMSLAAISMISQICNLPEKVLDNILKNLYKKLVDQNGNLRVSGDADIFESDEVELLSVKEILLERLILIHGEILFRKWHYLNNDVINALSKNNKIAQAQNNGSDEEMDEFEAEYRDAEEDDLINTVTGLCEELVLEDSTFDAYIRDLTVKVCLSSRKEPYSSTLKSAAATSLAKYMMISQSFCEEKIQLFITLMETSKDEVVRSNLVLAIGDLLMRFPNVIEPWTTHLFSRLSDPCTVVRKNTVVVICHLVSREMVKVRRIADVCLCLDDPEPSIAEKVHNLFVDLSKKGNTIYNIIPEIISRLSNPERSEKITSELFDKIMKFILGLIGKERQNELLVEKLCSRLSDSTNMRQWRDLAFCLQQLNYSEKALKKLIDALPTLNEKLLCSDVHNAIISIFNSAQKSSKQNLKETASEGIARVEQLLTSKDKDGDNADRTSPDDIFITPLKNTSNLPPKTRSTRKVKKPRF